MAIPEFIARKFHEYYEELAPEHGYETREASAVPWEEVPENNRKLMLAVVLKLLENGIIEPTYLGIKNQMTKAEWEKLTYTDWGKLYTDWGKLYTDWGKLYTWGKLEEGEE